MIQYVDRRVRTPGGICTALQPQNSLSLMYMYNKPLLRQGGDQLCHKHEIEFICTSKPYNYNLRISIMNIEKKKINTEYPILVHKSLPESFEACGGPNDQT